MSKAASPHSNTPTLAATDPRGLPLRRVGYCRQRAEETAQARIERHAWSIAGHLQASRDPRGLDYLRAVHGLSGQALLSDSMDAGWKLHLPGETGQPLFTWDARGSHWRLRCDELLRPVEIGESAPGGSELVSERYTYAGADASFAAHNQCGRLLRHDDPGGTLHLHDYALTGSLERQTRHFLQSLDAVDWPAASADRDLLLEPGEGFTTVERFNPLGQLRSRGDARGNLSLFQHTLDGRPGPFAVQLAGASLPTPLRTSVDYDAWGQVARCAEGNGVLVEYTRDPANGRLLRLHCGIPEQPALLDLHYQHDPLGNTLEIVDQAQPVRHFANQRIEPRCEYRHDSLYQLVEASGREFIGARPGPDLPALQPLPGDPSQLGNYRQHYQYDAAGNLVQLRHVGTQDYTRTLQIAADSNRALALDTPPPDEAFDAAFDACGNPRQLLPGQGLDWTPRNRLARLASVTRDEAEDDSERYVYDAAGNRLRKVSQQLASGRTLLGEVRYLPGLELRRDDGTGERLQAILCDGLEILHWEQGLPTAIDNDQQRYSLRDHLGSHALEMDGQAVLLSQELYYPFGGSAWWAAASSSQARYKYRRYAGKERDASGLYYYGQRYYAPWLQRWLNPDPAGYVDGANLYRMVGNRPMDFTDHQGTVKIPLETLLGDVLDPMAKQIGTGWYEELRWDSGTQAFARTEMVYGRGMSPLESQAPSWSLSDDGSPIALFRDNEDKLRLFTNTHFQHMGIQPGMGLPLFAGLIKRGENGRILFNNHSGHYKPPAMDKEVENWLKALAPGASNLDYHPIEQSLAFSDALRLESVAGPEDYADMIKRFSRDKPSLIPYLKETGQWDDARRQHGDNQVLNLIFEMHDKNMDADQVNKARHAAAMAAATPAPKPVRKARVAPCPPSRSTAVMPRRSGGFLGLFRQCVGR